MSAATVERRFIAAVIKDGEGDRWRECLRLGADAFADAVCRKAWTEIVRAPDYEKAATHHSVRPFFKEPTDGAEYLKDRSTIWCRWLQTKGLDFHPQWSATLPLHAGHCPAPMEWDSLLAFDPKNDPNCLLGNRYLCRTDGALLYAPAGVGKSVLGFQIGACAALGDPIFSVKVHKPLRVTLIQAEDNAGDVSEQAQGFVKGFRLGAEQLTILKDRMRILRWNDCAGDSFLARLRSDCRQHPSDLLIINPLLSFAGCNVSDQMEMSRFLRNGLNPILSEANALSLIIHHTGKPPKDDKNHGSTDLNYLAFGSSELTNWARAIMSLQQVKSAGASVYKLTFAKRGKRAGIIDESGNPADSVYIEHSSTGLCWLPSDWRPSQGQGGRFQQKFDIEKARAIYDPKLTWKQNENVIAASLELTTRAVRYYRELLETE